VDASAAVPGLLLADVAGVAVMGTSTAVRLELTVCAVDVVLVAVPFTMSVLRPRSDATVV
jgi:hypothetical protein